MRHTGFHSASKLSVSQSLVSEIRYRMTTDKDRVTTHLENLEISGNSNVVREKSGKMEKVREKSGVVKSGVFIQALNTPKLVFGWGSALDLAGDKLPQAS